MKHDRIGLFRGVACVALFVLLLGVSLACSQNTEAPIEQQPRQDTESPAWTEQEAATQGSQVNIWVVNAPGKDQLPNGALPDLGAGDAGVGFDGLIDGLASQNGGENAALEKSNAGYAQAGINITVTTGGTTPSLTGTATAAATGTQTATAQPTLSPIQDVRPRTSVSLPIAWAPAGIIDQAAAATAGEGAAQLDKTSQNELRWARVEALAEKIDQLGPVLQALDAIIGDKPPKDVTTNGTQESNAPATTSGSG